jgi:hypothetical protein
MKRIKAAIKRFIIRTIIEDIRNGGELSQAIIRDAARQMWLSSAVYGEAGIPVSVNGKLAGHFSGEGSKGA